MPPIKSKSKNKKKKFQADDRVEAALKEISSYRQGKGSTRDSSGDAREKGVLLLPREGPLPQSNNAVIGHGQQQSAPKTTAEQLDDLAFLFDTFQITQESYDAQRDAILAARHQAPSVSFSTAARMSEEDSEADTDTSSPPPKKDTQLFNSIIFGQEQQQLQQQAQPCASPAPSPLAGTSSSSLSLSQTDRSSSSPTQDSEQGSMGPMGLFQEEGVYSTGEGGEQSTSSREGSGSRNVDGERDDSEEEGEGDDDSEVSLRDTLTRDDSLSSVDSEDWLDELEILAMKNKQRNKDHLTELYLDLIEGRPMTPLQTPTHTPSVSSQNSPSSSLKCKPLARASSSVNFSEHDIVQEYEKDAKFSDVIPINMDPNDIYSFDSNDSGTALSSEEKQKLRFGPPKRNPSFIIPEYKKPSKMSLQKTAKKGSFFAAMKKKKADAAAAKNAADAAATVAAGDTASTGTSSTGTAGVTAASTSSTENEEKKEEEKVSDTLTSHISPPTASSNTNSDAVINAITDTNTDANAKTDANTNSTAENAPPPMQEREPSPEADTDRPPTLLPRDSFVLYGKVQQKKKTTKKKDSASEEKVEAKTKTETEVMGSLPVIISPNVARDGDGDGGAGRAGRETILEAHREHEHEHEHEHDEHHNEHRENDHEDIEAARARLTKLLLESPEFRTTVLAYPEPRHCDAPPLPTCDVRLDAGGLDSVPQYKLGVPAAAGGRNPSSVGEGTVQQLSETEIIDRRIAKWNARLGLDAEDLKKSSPSNSSNNNINNSNNYTSSNSRQRTQPHHKMASRVAVPSPAPSASAPIAGGKLKAKPRRRTSPPRRGGFIEHSDNDCGGNGDGDVDLFRSSSQESEESSVLPETRSAAFSRLTQPKIYSSPSVELAKPPPQSGTQMLDLPCDDVRLLVEKCREEKSFIIHLEPCEEKLRLKVKATEETDDWEHSNKFSYYGLNFNRSEFMEFEETIVPYRPTDAATSKDQEMEANGRVVRERVGRGLSPTKSSEVKKKLLISHDEAYDFLYINRLKLLRKLRPHLAQMDIFCNRYFVSFLCLVFDLKMQLLGTYDHKLGKYFPGVVVCPPHAQRQKRRRDNHRYSNVLEIDFNKLPVDTFAVVPVVCDVSPRTAEFPGVHLQLDVAVNSIEDNFRRAFESNSKSQFNNEYSESHASSVGEQFDVDDTWAPLPTPEEEDDEELKNHFKPSVSPDVLPAHVDTDFLDKNWTHVESFFVERASTLPNNVGVGPQYSINQNQTRSRTVPLSNRSSYVPFILFRRLDHARKGTATGERLWSIKGVQKTFEGILPHVVARNVLEVMKEAFIMPIHHINVEHCINCDKHKSTTWHVPGSYEKRFEDLQAAVQLSLPPCIVTSNKFTCDTDHIPRIGSFDVTIRPFFSDITQLLHSKVISKQFPTPEKLVLDLATLLLPEKVTFTGVHTLELHVYDGYDRIPLKGAHVKLYRVEVNPSSQRDLAEVVVDFKKKPVKEEVMIVSPSKPCAANNWLMPLRKVEPKEPKEEKEEEEKQNKGMPQIPRDSIAYKKKRDLGKGFTARMVESKSLAAARMRHSKSFFSVRTWRKEEMSGWLKSYGLPDEVVQAAVFDGAVDGPSFLSIASPEAFQRWGIKSRIKLSQMQKSLEELKRDHTGNIVTSYDPYTYNELLEGAADRHAPSPLHSEPAQPRESKSVQDVTYHPVGSKKTGPRGLCFMNVDVLGSYMLRIEAPHCTAYCSHVFQINSSGHSAFCASLNPKIGLAKFRVKLETGINEENFEGVDEAGILLSMVNLHNGKRHIAVVKFHHPSGANAEAVAVEQPKDRGLVKHCSEGMIVQPRKQFAAASSVDDGSAISRSESVSSSSSGSGRSRKGGLPLLRSDTAGSLLMKGLLSRNSGHSASASFIGGSRPKGRTSIVEENTATNKLKIAAAQVVVSYCTAEIYLPIGKYYSEVDGAVFCVKPTIDDDCSDKTWGNISPEFMSGNDNNLEGMQPQSPSSVEFFDYTEEQTRKCHRRIVMSSVRAFQKIYRRYKKNFLRDNIWAYLTLKRSFRRVLKRIRFTILIRHVIKVQRHVRMKMAVKKFRLQKRRVALCGVAMRRYIAKKQVKKLFSATELIKKFTRRWLRYRRFRRFMAAVTIQKVARRMAAQKKYVQFMFVRRLSRRSKRYLAYIRQRLADKKILQAELIREQTERLLMDAEHERVITFKKEKEQYEKEVIRRKINLMERRLSKQATRLQKCVRGFLYRLKMRKITTAVVVLQKRHRLFLFEEQLKRKPKNLHSKQRFIAYCPTFPALRKNPQLLGATKLLQGMYDKDAHTAWLLQKNSPSIAVQPSEGEGRRSGEDDAFSLTSSQFKQERKRSFVETILHRVLDSPATRITSVMLMNRDRTRYVKHWQEAYGTDDTPPLFRHLQEKEDKEEVLEEQERQEEENNEEQDEEKEEKEEKDKAVMLAERGVNNKTPLLSKSLSALMPSLSFKSPFNLKVDLSETAPTSTGGERRGGKSKSPARKSSASKSPGPTWSDRLPPPSPSSSPIQMPSHSSSPTSKDNTKTKTKPKKLKLNKRNRAAVTIQKIARGYIVRSSMQECKEQDDDISAITKVTLAKTSSFALPITRQFSNVSQSLGKSLKRGLSSTSLKSLSSHTKVKELSRSVSSGINRMHSATSLMKEKYEEKVEVKKEFKAQQAVQLERQRRLEQHEVNVEDAILHLSGWDESQLPRLNRKWFLCAFPLLAGEGPEKVMRKNKFTETNFYQNVLSKNSETYEEENEHLEYEMSNNRFPGEAVRTADLAPLSREAFEKLNFNVHLADYLRYSRVHLVLYIQTGEEGGDDANAVRPDALPRNTSIPTLRDLYIDKKDPPAYFLPAFHGTVVMNQGKAFTPCGGRLNVNLTPIANQAIYLSRAQAKRLALMKGVRIAATLSPVAVPAAPFLYSLLCKQTPPPTYPSEILDAVSFEKTELDLKEFYGAALCMIRFKDRNLVSTRHRGMPHGVLEFSAEGTVVGKAIEYRESMGTITSMVAGFEHLLCCGSTGHLAVYMQDAIEEGEDYSLAPSSYTTATVSANADRLLTHVRTFSDLHTAPVVSCAAVHRAGMDILFTLDKSDNIGVIVMERGLCLRSYLNESFVTFHITSFTASHDRLYLGLSSGIVVTINLSEIMNGNVNAARNLHDHILGRDVVFSKEAGISTMTIMSQHDFFGCHNDDVPQMDVLASVNGIDKKQRRMGTAKDSDSDSDNDEYGAPNKKKNKTALLGLQRNKLQGPEYSPPSGGGAHTLSTGEIAVNPKCVVLPNPPLEGHVILVAGGDKDPRVKVLLPLNTRKAKEKDQVDDPDIGFGFREVYALPGHAKATTQMVVDAAGRFIITASQGSRQMCVWNALTENCEMTHNNVNAAFIGLSNNALFMCSFKAPFLTIWKPPQPIDPKKRYRKKIQMEDGRHRYEDIEKGEPSIDGRPEIGFVRANVWCMNTIQGGMTTPDRSLAETDFFLGGNGRGRHLVDFWKRYFDRGVKTISKLAPPPTIKQKSQKHLNPKGAMAKGLRSKIKLQRRLDSQVSSISEAPSVEPQNDLAPAGFNRSTESFPFDRVEENTTEPETPYYAYHDFEAHGHGHGHDSRELQQLQPQRQYLQRTFSQAEDNAQYNSYYDCYYDPDGNPYNYDDRGSMYYYYDTQPNTNATLINTYSSNDFATDTSVKQMSGYDDGEGSGSGHRLERPSDEFKRQEYNRAEECAVGSGRDEHGEQPSLSASVSMSVGNGNDITAESSVHFNENQVEGGSFVSDGHSHSHSQEITSPVPQQQSLLFFDESYRTSSRYEEGFNDDSYDENFSANNGLEFNQPYRSVISPMNTITSVSMVSSQQQSQPEKIKKKKKKRPDNVDDYGFSKKTSLEAERDDEEYFDFRASSGQGQTLVHGHSPGSQTASQVKNNPLSRLRRHMHMSDSEESDDEKLASIYKAKRTEIRLRNEMNAQLELIVPNSYRYEEQVNEIKRAYGFESEILEIPDREEEEEDGRGGRGGGYAQVHEDMSHLLPEDSFVSGGTGLDTLGRDEDVSVLSVTNERKQMMAKRQKLLNRRVLYQIDGDSD